MRYNEMFLNYISSEEPAVAIAPAPVIEEIAPAPLPEPEIVAPAPVVAPAEYVKPAPVVVPAPVVEAEPVVAPAPVIAPAPVVVPAPAPVVHPAPVVVPAPAPVIAPAPIVHQAPVVVSAPAPVPVPVPVEVHHHHPRTEIRNVATSYHKVSGHRSDTVMVSGDDHHFGHFSSSLEFLPHDHFIDYAAYPVPLRARVNRKKLASKKTAKARKAFEKRKN
ncbi:hypothetical protein Y032_0116g602 [Ancylostoma ceylanicum]|uniref:Uncharacterized protein n=2 Tax=Ancylostoma ceylanicum TaxID=53326 RepID=A0A016TCJ3_9BILA|nr:hypothetical protein Y032_0116g602 [Ancylostoma ceylanicum]